MHRFDHENPVLVPVAEMVPRIGNAWLAQWRSHGISSGLIKVGTGGGVHSHSSLLRKNYDGTVDVLQMTIKADGGAVPLEDIVADYPDQIDVFSYDPQRWPEFDAAGCMSVMRRMTGRRYGIWGVFRLALMRTPILWHCWPLNSEDEAVDGLTVGAPFCSHAASAAARVGGRVDPVPRKPDWLTTPDHLTCSMLWSNYEGTLTP